MMNWRSSRPLMVAAGRLCYRSRRSIHVAWPGVSRIDACSLPNASGTSRLLSSIITDVPRREASTITTTRRRRKGETAAPRPKTEDDEHRGVHHEPITDMEVFQKEAERCLRKVNDALKPMVEHNDVFVIDYVPRNAHNAGSLTLTLSPELGVYEVQVDDENRVLYFQTPISGKIVYILSKSTREWVSQDDGHLFEGLLVRDLIRQCNGLPNL